MVRNTIGPKSNRASFWLPSTSVCQPLSSERIHMDKFILAILGYISTHIPGGLLAQNFSAKYVHGIAVVGSAFCSMLIPLAVRFGKSIKAMIYYYTCHDFRLSFSGGYYAIVVMRILMGAFQGPLFPSTIQMLAVWVPATERSFLTTIAYSGSNVNYAK